MVSCTECGAAIEENSKFCANADDLRTDSELTESVYVRGFTILLKDIELAKLVAKSRQSASSSQQAEYSSAMCKEFCKVRFNQLQPARSLSFMPLTLWLSSEIIVISSPKPCNLSWGRPFDGPGDTLVSFPGQRFLKIHLCIRRQ